MVQYSLQHIGKDENDMPTSTELRAMQKRTLHSLLLIKHEAKNVKLKELDSYISSIIAEMEVEDVAYVKQIVEELLSKL